MTRKQTKLIWGMLLSFILFVGLIGCSQTTSDSSASEGGESTAFEAGTYTAAAKGNNGEVTVEVEFDETSIVSVTVKEHSETAGLSDTPIERIPQAIVDGQSLAVDTVSGASNTSKAILAAVEDCVKQAGGNVEALKTAAANDKEKTETEVTTDVVVIGGGGTGLAAAGSVFENGADVIVLEKQAALGGSTALSGGDIGAPGTRFQEEQGVEDSKEAWMELWKERQATSNPDSQYPNWEKVDKFMSDAIDTTHWLVDNMNHKYVEVRGFGVDPVARLHHPEKNGSTITENIEKTLKDNGIDILLETKATEILTDDKGDVIGVKAENAEGILTVHAKKVIIATGGFAQNEEMMKELIPDMAPYMDVSAAAAGSTGDGITMASEVGAELYEDPWFIGLGIATKIKEISMLEWDPTKIYVNNDGKRYMNENSHYAIVTNESLKEGQTWMVIDSSEANAQTVGALEAKLPNAEIVKGESMEELAEEMGIPVDSFVDTLNSYNTGVASGKDEFGKDPSMLVPVENGPYYAVKLYPRTMGTFGGVKVNENYQVLKTDGSVINNLYAGGEAANRDLYNQVYMTGSAVQYALTSGRLSGEHAAIAIKASK